MRYDFSSDAMKAMENLDANTAGRIIKGIIGLPAKGDIKPLKGYEGVFRLRIGDYRILYKVLGHHNILIDRISPRGEIYKGV